jgi:hypothetical protein
MGSDLQRTDSDLQRIDSDLQRIDSEHLRAESERCPVADRPPASRPQARAP